MRQKKVKALRKKLNLKLPVKADLRIVKKVKKVVYFTNPDGSTKAVPSERIVVVNAAKYQYRQIKKIFKGMR